MNAATCCMAGQLRRCAVVCCHWAGWGLAARSGLCLGECCSCTVCARSLCSWRIMWYLALSFGLLCTCGLFSPLHTCGPRMFRGKWRLVACMLRFFRPFDGPPLPGPLSPAESQGAARPYPLRRQLPPPRGWRRLPGARCVAPPASRPSVAPPFGGAFSGKVREDQSATRGQALPACLLHHPRVIEGIDQAKPGGFC